MSQSENQSPRQPLVSVVTICRNEGERIRETADSVVAQTYPRVEWIVVDGVSTDGTLEILGEYRERIAELHSGNDSGVYAAQNRGARMATGDFLLFLNGGDSFASPDSIARLVAASESVDLVYGDLIVVHETGREEAKSAPDRIALRRLMYDTVWHPATLISAALFRKSGPYDESFRIAGDYDFFLKAIVRDRARLRRCPHPIARFRLGGISSIPANRAKVEAERRRAQEGVLGPLFLELWDDWQAAPLSTRALQLGKDCARAAVRTVSRPARQLAIRWTQAKRLNL